MAKICETCDTKNRLGMCDGNKGEFKYCVRRTGTLSNIPGSITPFNEIDEIFSNPVWNELEHDSVLLDTDFYGMSGHMRLLYGRWDWDRAAKEEDCLYPVGYVVC